MLLLLLLLLLRDVTKNLLSECGTLSTFAGFKSLEQLYLTSSALTADICNCPGGNYSWTVELNGHCLGRKPLCNSTFSRIYIHFIIYIVYFVF